MPDEPLNNEQIEPSSPLPINTTGSEPSNMPLEAPESPKNADIPVSLNNANTKNEPISTPSPEEIISLEPTDIQANPASDEVNKLSIEPVSEPVQASEPSTAQTPVNKPLAPESEPIQTQSKSSLARQLLISARNVIQFRKRKKLDKIMSLFLQQSKITNDEVEKFLHVSDATATRYLSQLEKENKIKQTGKTGHSVFYSKI